MRRRRTRVIDENTSAFDLVGSPDPVSNLRPVQYRSIFGDREVPLDNLTPLDPSVHPYTEEYPTEGALATGMTPRLAALRRRYELYDMAWRLHRRRMDDHSQTFWSRVNIAFEEDKQAYIERAQQRAKLANQPFDADAALPEFYAAWLARHRLEYKDYNAELWRLTWSALAPAMMAKLRNWRWRFEVWRAGASGHA
ncbi:uncharacterized protein L969DRAFT_16278 [Mixia osmundae IAM 14324]|uniref:Uncharacterized protein n=1 Tax=Mixia osmundae (strain CBS 9802 / IAM 14324 / JCM 22182 / KY 12970) TaxID=764103 RepID=G7DSB2_MIXOS|nr:uncharacterized protein L969DRAFT_16278 [Mixia osmundae IAM 14324]KEI40924.1 hypothetical protein L969DRAFT_16278 [Mixia osmundae IAM 14324]GAA93472.1 hypothetical protein E5Q_00113 [Mixia osmundae IAM 14324]